MKPLPAQTDPSVIWGLLWSLEGTVAFDIGANTGQVAKILARRFKRVYAFEPCQESFDRIDAPDNVIRSPLAVSDHLGSVVLDESENSIETGQLTTGQSLGWGQKVGERRVPCTVIDALPEKPDFVKIDTEGHEVQVVRGGTGTFWADDRPRILIEVHAKDNDQPIRNMLGTHYRFEKILHPYYGDLDAMRDEHFWLFCTPKEEPLP